MDGGESGEEGGEDMIMIRRWVGIERLGSSRTVLVITLMGCCSLNLVIGVEGISVRRRSWTRAYSSS